MSGYDIFLSNGGLLTTVNVKTVDTQQHSSLFLIGQGIPDYGTMIAQDFVWLLENFSKTTPPVHPLMGQIWHDRVTNRENFWNGTVWVPILSSGGSTSELFLMLSAANSVDFTATATTVIFTGAAGKTYFPTAVVLIPVGSVTAATAPTFNLFTNTPGDILVSTAIASIGTTKYARFDTRSDPAFISGTDHISVQVTTAATGGLCAFKILVFGYSQ